MRTLRGFLYLILGGTLCGWMFNRIAAWFIDNPLTVGSNHTVAEWAVILQDPFYLDSRTMPFFFLAFGAIALVAMTKYDWTGEREEQKKLRGDALIDSWYNRKRIGLEKSFDLGGDAFSQKLPEILVSAYAELMPMYEYFMEIYRACPETGRPAPRGTGNAAE